MVLPLTLSDLLGLFTSGNISRLSLGWVRDGAFKLGCLGMETSCTWLSLGTVWYHLCHLYVLCCLAQRALFHTELYSGSKADRWRVCSESDVKLLIQVWFRSQMSLYQSESNRVQARPGLSCKWPITYWDQKIRKNVFKWASTKQHAHIFGQLPF